MNSPQVSTEILLSEQTYQQLRAMVAAGDRPIDDIAAAALEQYCNLRSMEQLLRQIEQADLSGLVALRKRQYTELGAVYRLLEVVSGAPMSTSAQTTLQDAMINQLQAQKAMHQWAIGQLQRAIDRKTAAELTAPTWQDEIDDWYTDGGVYESEVA